jgi:uncharacterized protein DUF4154
MAILMATRRHGDTATRRQVEALAQGHANSGKKRELLYVAASPCRRVAASFFPASPRCRVAASFFIVALLTCFGFGQAFKEYDLKAVFLYNFTQFVEWPPEAFPNDSAPIVIGVLGTDRFGKSLEETVRNEVVRNRKLEVVHYSRVEEIKTCHILFVSQSEAKRLDQILTGLKDKNILTVGETEEFTQRGGVIGFSTEKNKIRLRINLAAAREAHLTISSKLLRVAETE